MGRLQDQDYLQNHQYKDHTRLEARIRLHKLFSTNQKPWFEWVYEHIQLSPGCHILEVGCGPGDLWLENAHRIPKKCDIIFTDFSPGMVHRAANNLRDQPHSFHYGVVDAQWIPFPDAYFDVVVANHMFFHVPDRRTAFQNVHRVLKPKGRLYATTVGENHMQALSDLVASFDPDLKGQHDQEKMEFTLESGYEQLVHAFSHVRIYRQENNLHITQVEPLVEYVLSSVTLGVLEERRKAFKRFLELELSKRGGCIRIEKDNGMLVATRI